MRVMIADDLELVRMTLRRYVEQVVPSADICEASSLSDLLAEATNAQLLLILMDLKMPGMRGPDSIADVRAAFPTTTIVVVSGHADEEVKAAVIAAGADGYIPKTTRGDTMREALRGYCPAAS